MISKAIRTATLLLATLAIPAAVLVAPLSASAATSGSMCETYGAYCLNTANFNLYTPVTESPYGHGARTIDAVLQNGSSFLLEFNGDKSKCVALNNSESGVVIKACNGGSGVIWIKQGNKWLNQLASTTGTPQLNFYLTGLGNGSQYVVGTSSPGSGTFQQFSFV